MIEYVATVPIVPDINSRIAVQVRALRTGRGMSLDELGKQCGVSRSMLSLIERGESSPTAVVLEKIASGLGVPLASLFDDASVAPSPISRSCDRTSWRDPESGYVRRNISPANFPSIIRIVEVLFPAGATVSYDTGPAGAGIHQQVWVREGRIEVTVGDTTHCLSKGDCLAMERRHEPTRFRNRTRRPARYIVVAATERLHARYD